MRDIDDEFVDLTYKGPRRKRRASAKTPIGVDEGKLEKKTTSNDEVHVEQMITPLPNGAETLIKLDNQGLFFQIQKDDNLWKIVNQNGFEFIYDIRFKASSTPFVWYASDRILASQDSKFGFVSINGNITIPFKYDEIVCRKDGLFDVRVGDAWGIINLEGLEIVKIKYTEKLPLDFNNVIVEDALIKKKNTSYACGGAKGIINKKGIEYVPCIYDDLYFSNKNIIIFGYGEGSNEYYDTNVGYFKFNIKYGCMNLQGVEIIPPKYDCFIIQDGYILAGRDGCSYGRCHLGGSNICKIEDMHDFYGVFDLYDRSGQMILGGFNSFECDSAHSLYIFEFCGFWDYKAGGEDGNGIFHHSSYRYDDSNSKWLLLNSNLTSIMCLNDGERVHFTKGFNIVVKRTSKIIQDTYIPYQIRQELEKNQMQEDTYLFKKLFSQSDIIYEYEWNIPLDILSDEKPAIISYD